MEQKDTIRELAHMLRLAGIDKEDGITLSLMVRRPGGAEQLMDWMEMNPEASVEKIYEKAREIHRATRTAEHNAKQREWAVIMQMENPHEALKAIVKKIDTENLSIQEMEDRITEYLDIHNIELYQMTYYPNGGLVMDPDDVLTQEYEAKLGKISFYKRDGTLAQQQEINRANISDILGMMVRCIMKNGDIHEGFSAPFYREGDYPPVGRGGDYTYLWTWDHLDEETHRLIGDNQTRFDQTFTPIEVNKIISMDAILYSNPRWGGKLTNRFFLGASHGQKRPE